MRITQRFLCAVLATTCLAGVSGAARHSFAASPALPTAADVISGVVTSAKGPEAGVWVIAETMDVVRDKDNAPGRYMKEVVTDDQGRFVLPQLPQGKYKLWVRGYGLVDSKPVDGVTPGKTQNLTAVIAPDEKSAAQIYPANYWFSLIHPPAASDFPGTGPKGNGIAPAMASQQHWIGAMKNSCTQCHAFGDKATRELADNTVEGWAERLTLARSEGDPAVGGRAKGFAGAMVNGMTSFGRERGLSMYADWTQRIEKGELPKEAPPRPQGVERNVVLTVQDWGHGRFVHDTITTDRRDPTKNANGLIYAGANMVGMIEMFDPKTHRATEKGYGYKTGGVTQEHDPDTVPHSVAMDSQGRFWASDPGNDFSSVIGPGLASLKRPDFCTDEQNNKYAKYFVAPQPRLEGRIGTAVMLDPKTNMFSGITTCYGVHHVFLGRDKNEILYFGGDSAVFGWIDVTVYDQTKDSEKAMGWCPMVLDTKRKALPGDIITPDKTKWNQPGATRGMGENIQVGAAGTADLDKDTRMTGFGYGMDTSPVDASVWFANSNPAVPSGMLRFTKGANPPETCKTEYYEPPKKPEGGYVAFGGRGMSLDTKGVAWVPYGSGKFAAFDRRKCKVLRGPTATGQQCPEGWKFYDMPGPKIAGTDVNADFYYTDFVDQFDTLGLGKDTPIANGTNSDSLIAVLPETGKTVVMRVPYPMGFYSRVMDGRIDDAKAGWKGKGIYATYSNVPVWHQEGGNSGEGPELVYFQLRPDPMAH